jgi:putative MATE family efflux protein
MSSDVFNDSVTPAENRSLWGSLRLAIAGTEQDFTRGPISRAVFLLAVPMVLEMVMESVFAVCDVFFVSRLGAEAVATVGLTESLLTLVFGLAIGFSMATTALVARRIGEKRPDRAAVAADQALLVALVASVLLGGLGVVTAPSVLDLLGASDGVLQGGANYARVLLGGSGTIVFLFLINAVFRGAGDAAIAMRVLWLANLINIVLDPCLIFGLGPFPEMGVTGAAVATTIGRGVGVLYQLKVLLGGGGRVHVRLSDLRVDREVMTGLLRVSVGGVLQVLAATASWVGLMRVMALFGDTALAGYTIAIRIIIFSILPAWGLANAAATLVGQNLGAARIDRAERSVWQTSLYNMIFLGAIGLLFLILAEELVGLFSTDPAVLEIGADCLRILSYGYLFYALGMVMEQAFNGAGDTMTPTFINFVCYWVCQIPLAWYLAVSLGWGPRGVFWAIMVSETLLAVVGVAFFRRGRWKERQV